MGATLLLSVVSIARWQRRRARRHWCEPREQSLARRGRCALLSRNGRGERNTAQRGVRVAIRRRRLRLLVLMMARVALSGRSGGSGGA